MFANRMSHRSILWLALLTVSVVDLDTVRGQTDAIGKGNAKARIRNFAQIPDSGTGSSAPARINLMASDSAGRIFANDQRGKLYHLSQDGSMVTPYLDITNFTGIDLRTASGEQGFQSFAFHPDFHLDGAAGRGKFYTVHSSSNNAPTPDFNPGGPNNFHSVLLEWSVDDPRSATYAAGNGASPREVMRLQQPFSNHNAGMLAFNPTAGTGSDRGNLYFAVGDGGLSGDPQENAQDLGNPYGAILRINPLGNDSANGKYGIVDQNFFAADSNPATLGEIYAHGLRNPQRFSWDRLTGQMYIADIGQNAYEEINLGIDGGNYGWDEREGSFAFEGPGTPDMLDPIAEYDHDDAVSDPTTGGRAITVGDVVRDSGDPNLDGKLLFGDFPNGKVYYLDVDSDPFDGGQDGIFELDLVNSAGGSVSLIDLINDTRVSRGLPTVSRADLRFSFAVDGKTFLTNKRDGVIRQVLAIPEPGSTLAFAIGMILWIRRRARFG